MKIPRTTLLAFPVVLLLAAAPALAQAPAPPAAQAETAQAPAEQPEKAEGEGHHPEVKLFGHSLGPGAQFGVKVFNFLLFAGLLVLLLKGALASAFKARTKDLEDKLSQAERDKADAGRQIAELETRMAGLQQELAGIMAKAGEDAEAEKARILESARGEAAQIRAQTLAEIESQQRQAEAELRALVADLVVAGAAQRLEGRVRGEVAAKVLDRAIEEVGGAK